MVYSSTVLLKLNWEIAMTSSINLLESIEERPNMDPQQVELAWLAEANRRFQAYQAGKEQAIPADEVFADLRADDR